MITTKLCVAVRWASIDKHTNEVSLFSVLDRIVAQDFPIFFSPLAFISFNERLPGDDGAIDITFTVSMDGDTILTNAGRINFPDGSVLQRNLIRVNGLVIPRPGVLRFSLAAGERELCSYTVSVSAAPAIERDPQPAAEPQT